MNTTQIEQKPIDFTDAKQMAQDAWLFLTNDTMPNKYKISKSAFLHEVGCMLELMKGHYERIMPAVNKAEQALSDIGEGKEAGEPVKQTYLYENFLKYEQHNSAPNPEGCDATGDAQ